MRSTCNFSIFWEAKLDRLMNSAETSNGRKLIRKTPARTAEHMVGFKRRRNPQPRNGRVQFTPSRPVRIVLLRIDRVRRELHLGHNIDMLRAGTIGNGTVVMRLGGGFSLWRHDLSFSKRKEEKIKKKFFTKGREESKGSSLKENLWKWASKEFENLLHILIGKKIHYSSSDF